jgi:hypothetical protein
LKSHLQYPVHQSLLFESGVRGLYLFKKFLYSLSVVANGPEFATREGRLQNISRIHCAFPATSTHKGMDLINKKNNFSITGTHFATTLSTALQTLLYIWHRQ